MSRSLSPFQKRMSSTHSFFLIGSQYLHWKQRWWLEIWHLWPSFCWQAKQKTSIHFQRGPLGIFCLVYSIFNSVLYKSWLLFLFQSGRLAVVVYYREYIKHTYKRVTKLREESYIYFIFKSRSNLCPDCKCLTSHGCVYMYISPPT